MILITVHMTEQYVKALDKLVELKLFPSRSEAIRVAIRDFIDRYTRYVNQNDLLERLLMTAI